MTNTSQTIIRRITAPGRQIADTARTGRSKSLTVISQYSVVTTDNGRQTHENFFDNPPTIGQLIKRVGPDAWVVSVGMRHFGRKARPIQILSTNPKAISDQS